MADAIPTFRDLVKVRNEAVHGDLVDVTRDHANGVQRLLVRMFKADVGITELLPWETHPAIYGMRTTFRFVAPEASPGAEGPEVTGHMPWVVPPYRLLDAPKRSTGRVGTPTSSNARCSRFSTSAPINRFPAMTRKRESSRSPCGGCP